MSCDERCSHSKVLRVTTTATGGYSTDHWQCAKCPMSFVPEAKKCEEKCEIIFRCKVCASLLDECVIKECPCKCHQKEEKPECSTWCNPKCLADPCPCSCHGNPQSACLCNGVECICHTPKEELKRRTETHTVEPEERRHEFDGISALCKHCGLNYLYWRKCPCKPKEPKPEKCENLTSEEFGERYGLKKSDYYTKEQIEKMLDRCDICGGHFPTCGRIALIEAEERQFREGVIAVLEMLAANQAGAMPTIELMRSRFL